MVLVSYHHITTSAYHIILPSYHHLIVSPYHPFIISSYHVMSSYHHIMTSFHRIIISLDQPKFPEKRIRHFPKNWNKRPGESSIHKGFRCKSRDDRPISPKSGMWTFETSSGSKITRIVQISTIFGRNRSRRPKMFFNKFSRRRTNFHVDKEIAANKRWTNERTNNYWSPSPPSC